MVNPDPGVEGIRSVLVRLRTRSGLSAERLRSTEVGVDSVLELPIVRQVIATTGRAAPEAAVETIRHMAGLLAPTDLVIVDAVLALGVLGARFPESADFNALYAADLGERRESLVVQWDSLHRLLDVEAPPRQPTVRALRANLEAESIGRLAELCVTTSVLEATAEPVGESGGTGNASIAVLGAAVTDLIFVVRAFPTTGTSAQASSFQESPGGKGLNQAVASVRHGMDVHLITALGDDERGQSLMAYMRSVQLPTNLVKVVQNAQSPVVNVTVTRSGGTATSAWMNEGEIRLDSADIQTGSVRSVLDNANAVVITFEPSIEAIRAALQIVQQRTVKPLLLVRPSPPLGDPQFLYEYFPSIDYLVGTQWELRRLLPGLDGEITHDELARSLLMLGVKGVCITEEFGSLIRSEDFRVDIGRFPAAMRDTPGAREAFTAALIKRLLAKKGQISEKDVQWATAAMAASQSYGGVADSMPQPRQVDHILRVSPGATT
jgi:ribokinase